MRTFKAVVQYGDLKGSVAADCSDKVDPTKWLFENGYTHVDEHILGITMRVLENHGEHSDPVSVKFLVSKLNDYDDIPTMLKASGEPIRVREIIVDMKIAEFLSLFKRLNLTLSNDYLMENKNYTSE